MAEAMLCTRSADSDALPGLLDSLDQQPSDPLLALIGAYRDDPRLEKIDVGVGVYRDLDGGTPILRAVKAAERRLVETQISKGYLGPEGDIGFFERLKPILFGGGFAGDRVGGLQTPGGTGALRLAAELIATARRSGRVLAGNPTWANHMPILKAAGLEIVGYEHFDVASQTLTFDRLVEALDEARPGDVALLHGCCHNPTGADLDPDQWTIVAALLRDRGVLPLIDLAYQGLGAGLDADAAGVRIVLDHVDEALIAYSCDKNFGLYRERTGALFAVSRNAAAAAVTQSNLLSLARANWSMPPDHGAAIVRTILEDEALTADWRLELEEMRSRLVGIRQLLAAADPALSALTGQYGMFSTLPLSPDQVRVLREVHAIYMPSSGRINVAGLTPATVPRFVAALAAVR
jgi:aromatic-amino-acid transaminase